MPPRPLYYVIRPGAVTELPSGGRSQGPARLVPLVAVDQLPDWINIVGVPRQMKPEEATDMLAITSDTTLAGDLNSGVFEVKVLAEKLLATQPQTQAQAQTNKTPAFVELPKAQINVEKTDKTDLISLTPSPDAKEKKDKTEGKATDPFKKEDKVVVKKESTETLKLANMPMIGGDDNNNNNRPSSAPAPTLTPTLTPAQTVISTNTVPPSPVTDTDTLGLSTSTAIKRPTSQQFLDKDSDFLVDRYSGSSSQTYITNHKKDLRRRTMYDPSIVSDLIDLGVGEGAQSAQSASVLQLDGPAEEMPAQKTVGEAEKAVENMVEKLVNAFAKTPPHKRAAAAAAAKAGNAGTKSPSKSPKAAKTSPKAAKGSSGWVPYTVSKKNPCKNWCLHGQCYYKDKCYYKHEMPKTLKELKFLGIDEFPEWWTKLQEKKKLREEEKKKKEEEEKKAREEEEKKDEEEKKAREEDEKAEMAKKKAAADNAFNSRASWSQRVDVKSKPAPTTRRRSNSSEESGPYLMQLPAFKELKEKAQEHAPLAIQAPPRTPEKQTPAGSSNQSMVLRTASASTSATTRHGRTRSSSVSIHPHARQTRGWKTTGTGTTSSKESNTGGKGNYTYNGAKTPPHIATQRKLQKEKEEKNKAAAASAALVQDANDLISL